MAARSVVTSSVGDKNNVQASLHVLSPTLVVTKRAVVTTKRPQQTV